MTGSSETEETEAEVVTVANLKQILNVSELSTYTAIYNGIAEVENEDDPESLDYYVTYEAQVNAGINFSEIEIVIDDEEKVIKVTLPEVRITDVSVDIGTLDFIFKNDKANTSTVSQEAYKVCEADVKAESETQKAIYELAKQNAVNICTALVKPLIEQQKPEYTLIVK